VVPVIPLSLENITPQGRRRSGL